MVLRWRGVAVSLLAVACGSRSSLLVEDSLATSDGATGSGASNPGRAGGGAAGSGAAPSVGAAPGSGAVGNAGGSGAVGNAGGSGAVGNAGGSVDFDDYEPTIAGGIYPGKVGAPELALAMAPSGEAAVLFFRTKNGSVGQARWFGVDWEAGLPGTDPSVARVAGAWISEDGYRSWVSYESTQGSSPYPLGSEIFSGGIPFGVTTSVDEFQLPYEQRSFATPPVEIVIGRTGAAVAAFLEANRFQYLTKDDSALGDDTSFVFPHTLAAGLDSSGALISLHDRVVWDDARWTGSSLLLTTVPVDGTDLSGLPLYTFVPFGLAYAGDDSAWGAWRVVPPIETSSAALIRFGLLRPGGDHLTWELPTIPSPRFLSGGGLTVSRDGQVAALTWGYRFFAEESQVRLAWIKNGRVNDGVTYTLETRSLCRVSAPAVSASGHRVIATAHCSDGGAYLVGTSWLVKLTESALDLPVFALSDPGDIGLVAWTEWQPWDVGHVETRTLVW